MTKNKLKVLGILPILSLLILFGLVTPSNAAQFEKGDYTLEQSEIVEENLYIGDAQTVNIEGVIDGDLFIAANTITISGTITGDIYVAGSTIDILGNVYGSAYIAGQQIGVSGSIAQNATIATMYADISGTVGKDLTVFANDSKISPTGKIMEDVRIFSSTSTISGVVKGESMIYSATSITDSDLLEGDVYENYGVEETPEVKPEINVNWRGNRGMFGLNIFSSIVSFVGMYIVGILIISLAPVKALKIEKKVTGSLQEFLFSFLIGLGISVVVPLPLIVLAFTFVGTPLAILITCVLIFVYTFGRIWVESAIGFKILSKSKKSDERRLLSLLVGRGITTVVNFIPLLRGFYKWILGTVAIGAVVRMKYDCFKTGKKKS
jgi:hypothetical protein